MRKAVSFCIWESLPGSVEQRQEQVKRERQSLQCKINDLIQLWGRSREILHKAMVKKNNVREMLHFRKASSVELGHSHLNMQKAN